MPHHYRLKESITFPKPETVNDKLLELIVVSDGLQSLCSHRLSVPSPYFIFHSVSSNLYFSFGSMEKSLN